jgi:uncharacterized repeat protein (TIGR03803 family)
VKRALASSSDQSSSDFGSVYRISLSGNFTNLYIFQGPDGALPFGGLIQGSDGYFYGTTDSGGTNSAGTVFRISSPGALTTLWQFCSIQDQNGNCLDGAYPGAGLIQGSDGYFYGTTSGGGTNSAGTVFRISSAGALTTLWQFGSGPSDGASPWGGLIQGSDGYFYGTTSGGGTNSAGTVFRISSAGALTTRWQFCSIRDQNGNCLDGASPRAGLVQGSDGYFYGTAGNGGTNNVGTAFRISSAGALTTLWQFGSGPSGGWYPDAGLLQGSDGNFYGTTVNGGGWGNGTVFRISSNGVLTNLYSFGASTNDGSGPYDVAIQGSDGKFYGTTETGGAYGNGTVFRLSVPLNPPANQISAFQFLDVFDDTYIAFLIPSVAGEAYQLQYTDSMNPANWINSGDPMSSIGGPLTAFDLVEPMTPQRFYRFSITP